MYRSVLHRFLRRRRVKPEVRSSKEVMLARLQVLALEGTASPARLRLFTEDGAGKLADITAVISDAQADMRTFESIGEALRTRIEVALDVRDRGQLDRIVFQMKKISGVFYVERI